MADRVVLKKFKRNSVILYEEDTSEFMYIIHLGKVKVFQTTEDGREFVLAIHQPGEFFGEMPLIDGETAPATVLVVEDSLVFVISKSNFYALIFNKKKVVEQLLQILCGRLRVSWRKIQILNLKSRVPEAKDVVPQHLGGIRRPLRGGGHLDYQIHPPKYR